jgi:hypothetical protein
MAKASDAYGQALSAKTFITNEISATKAAAMKYSVNELNLFYRPNNGRLGIKDEFGLWHDERPLSAEMAVFVALAYRNMCRTTDSYLFWFADIVGPLGMYTRHNGVAPALGDAMAGFTDGVHHYPHNKPAGTRMPAWWGLAMYTGGGLFRRFGANIATMPGHGITNLDVMASTDNGGDIVLVNRDERLTRNIALTTTGVASGPVDVWQTDRNAPWDPPRKVATPTISGSAFTVQLPPMSVTRCVITP